MFAANAADQSASTTTSRASTRLIQARESSTVTTVTRVAAGRIRRARRAPKAPIETLPGRSTPRERGAAVKEAGMTKKKSTPTKPPGREGTPAGGAKNRRGAAA